MKLEPITATCPKCLSREIFYTCHTSCCFNHLCNDCKTTFELATHLGNGKEIDPAMLETPVDRDTSLPMVPCSECESSAVFQIDDSDLLFCTKCRAFLGLDYEKIR